MFRQTTITPLSILSLLPEDSAILISLFPCHKCESPQHMQIQSNNKKVYAQNANQLMQNKIDSRVHLK